MYPAPTKASLASFPATEDDTNYRHRFRCTGFAIIVCRATYFTYLLEPSHTGSLFPSMRLSNRQGKLNTQRGRFISFNPRYKKRRPTDRGPCRGNAFGRYGWSRAGEYARHSASRVGQECPTYRRNGQMRLAWGPVGVDAGGMGDVYIGQGSLPGMATGGVGKGPNSSFLGMRSSLELRASVHLTACPV